jgi:hypothetical protein
MEATQILRRLHQYRAWSNRQLLHACRLLSREQLDSPFEIGQGPADVRIVMMRRFEPRYIRMESGVVDRGTAFPNWSGGWVIAKKSMGTEDYPSLKYSLWSLRRWAEQAYTAIHSPRH